MHVQPGQVIADRFRLMRESGRVLLGAMILEATAAGSTSPGVA